jgi:uncharacterized protein (DUF58 family)
MDAVWLARAGRPTVRRTVEPAEVPRFGACTCRLVIDHSGGWLAVRAEGVDRIDAQPVEVRLDQVGPGRSVEVSYPVPTTRRGRLRLGPVLLRRYGPAGLTVAMGEEGGQAVAQVLPRALPVRAVPPGARHSHVGAEERVIRGGTDLVGLHEYQPGDDLRRVHWGTSARSGVLMVREDADPVRAHLTVVLDDRCASYRTPDAFEEAVEVAASLVSSGDAEGHPVRLRTVHSGLELSCGTAASAERLDDLLAALIDISCVDGEGGAPAAPDDLDVMAIVTGDGADVAALAIAVGHTAAGAVLVVDGSDARSDVAGPDVAPFAVLRGGRAEELLRAWDDLVSSRVVTA